MKAKIISLFFTVCVMFVTLFAIPQAAMAQAATDNILTVEEPLPNGTYSGVANLRGWAVSINGIEHIELLVDGTFKTNIPSGGLRTDVGDSFPTYPASDKSGFSMAYNYSDLSPGQHTFTLRAVDNRGNATAKTIAVFTTHFDVPGNFLADPEKVSLRGATFGLGTNNDRSLFIRNMTVDGKTYTILLDWSTPSQGFSITQISSP